MKPRILVIDDEGAIRDSLRMILEYEDYLFVGAATDNRFRAFDSKSGRELWSYQMARQGNAVPMTYRAANGKQYVAITASDTVMVFALP